MPLSETTGVKSCLLLYFANSSKTTGVKSCLLLYFANVSASFKTVTIKAISPMLQRMFLLIASDIFSSIRCSNVAGVRSCLLLQTSQSKRTGSSLAFCFTRSQRVRSKIEGHPLVSSGQADVNHRGQVLSLTTVSAGVRSLIFKL